MKRKNKIIKGMYGYLDHQRRIVLIRTIIMFAISLAIFFTGYITTGKRENLLTVAAVLGMLPASRSMVSLIMFFRFHTGSAEFYEKTKPFLKKEISCFFDSVITTEKKSYPVNVFFCISGNLFGYTEHDHLDIKLLEKHLWEMMRNNGIKNVNPKVFTDEKAFLDRLNDLTAKHFEEAAIDTEVIDLICALSL